ncbi:MAG: cyclic nucleotide-binding domain-containing protein [Alphaproteobacteria bacterium]|nr:MAG: cyclic nucleotide-binding domain-containing protein [Alphaproteobacteria bacterium]
MPIHGLEPLLNAHPLFRGMPEAFLKAVAGCARNVVFEAGTPLFHEGEAANDIFLIREGRVSLELDIPGAGPRTFLTEGPGGVIGLSWLVPPYVWTFDARARSRVRAVDFDATCLRDKCDADPELGYAVMKRFMPVIVKRLHDTRLQMLDLYHAKG